jgi:hypothetical protein
MTVVPLFVSAERLSVVSCRLSEWISEATITHSRRLAARGGKERHTKFGLQARQLRKEAISN